VFQIGSYNFRKAVPEKLFEQKTKESNKAPDLQNPIWKEHNRTKSSLPKSEAMKSSEGRYLTFHGCYNEGDISSD
jgi:hypothetical protein